MAAVTGEKGSVSFAGATDLTSPTGAHHLLANTWSGSIDREMHDVTPFNPTGGARQSLGGLHKMTGTMSGFLDASTAPDLSHLTDTVVAAFVLTATTSRTYSFNGWLSNWSVTSDAGAPATWSASFESDGAITGA